MRECRGDMGPDCSTCQPEQGRTFMTEREGWEHECGTVQPGLSSSEVCECVVGGGGRGHSPAEAEQIRHVRLWMG